MDDDFLKFMEHEFQNFNEICFSVYIFCDKKAGEKNTQLKKHLLFLFKVYYSLDNWREREITRNLNNNNLNIDIRNKLKVANEIFW